MRSRYRTLYIGKKSSRLYLKLSEVVDWIDILHCEHGYKADAMLKNGPVFDLIFCEYKVPGINGVKFFEYLQKHDFLKTSTYIIVHDKMDETLRHSILQHAIDDYFLQNIEIDILRKRVDYLIDFRSRKPNRITAVAFSLKEDGESGQKRNAGDAVVIDQLRRLSILQLFLKRLFDVLASSIALIVLSPVFLIVAVILRLESKGPVFYTSKRVGQRTFDFYKFRSMYVGSDARLKELEHLNQYAREQGKKEIDFNILCECQKEQRNPEEYCSELLVFSDGRSMCEKNFLNQKKEIAAPAFSKIKDDPRITKFGKIIRNTSIDELPQLFNVLKGDMSIVGNRPLPVNEAETLTSDQFAKRFLAPAGITGLWQVELRGKKGDMSEEERRKLDNDYYDNFSLWFDLKIILRTFPALFQQGNV